MELSSGTRLGRYEIRSRLGAGGMGEVFLAYDAELEREVAVKVIRDDPEESSERSRRFLQEAKAASALNHPNVAHVYEIGSQDGSASSPWSSSAGRRCDSVFAVGRWRSTRPSRWAFRSRPDWLPRMRRGSSIAT